MALVKNFQKSNVNLTLNLRFSPLALIRYRTRRTMIEKQTRKSFLGAAAGIQNEAAFIGAEDV